MTGKIFRSCFLVGLAVMILCTGLFVAVMASQYEEEVYQQLQEELAYVKHGMEESGQAYLTGLQTTQRLTWVDPDGTVLDDSVADPATMENHGVRAEIRLALELDKPIIVHDRQAHADVYALLKKYRPKGIVHCYSGSAEDAVQLASQGLYIGFGGACTFNGAKRAAKAIEALPLDAIVLETDCPYMAPEPVRGTRCDSSLIRYVGAYIAQRKALAPEEVFRTTAANARRVFGL